VVGIDFSEQMLDRATTAAEAMGITNVEFRQGDAERIPAESGAFGVGVVTGIFNLNLGRTSSGSWPG
jgi:arsenite methyltransferase